MSYIVTNFYGMHPVVYLRISQWYIKVSLHKIFTNSKIDNFYWSPSGSHIDFSNCRLCYIRLKMAQ
jgi:hypothetical protein